MKRNCICLAALGGALVSAPATWAADVTSYRIEKGQVFSQTSESDPQPRPFLAVEFGAVVEGGFEILGAEIDPPSSFAVTLDANASGSGYSALYPFSNQSDMNNLFGAGQYTFSIDSENDGFTVANLNMPAAQFPTTVPKISNFAATQSLDPDANFTLNWNAFAGASGNDYTVVRVYDSFGDPIFTERATGTSHVIPSGTFWSDDSFTINLRFVKEAARNTTDYPGAVGTVEFYNETIVTVETTEGGGGGEDDPPFLFITTPSNGATGVSTDTTVSFRFSEVMEETQSIQWSANVNPTNFSYAWAPDGLTLVCTYTGGFPQNATITWILNPVAGAEGNFSDLTGNELFASIFQGSFTTGDGTVDPCDGGGSDNGQGFFSVSKSANYVQTGNTAPVLDTENAVMFSAMFRSPTNFSTTAVTLAIPGEAAEPLPPILGGMFLFSEEFASPALMDASYPSGTYTFEATTSEEDQIASLTLGNSSGVPIPQVFNLVELQEINLANDFTLNFAAFTGAQENDGIFISIYDTQSGTVFMAPDFCKGIELANTATSVVIPANTFQSGARYEGSITFSRYDQMDTTSIENTFGSASVSVNTRFGFTVGGGNEPTPPTWLAPVRNADGTISFTLQGETGITYVIEGSTDLDTWIPISTETALTGNVVIQITPGTPPHRFYRGKVQL